MLLIHSFAYIYLFSFFFLYFFTHLLSFFFLYLFTHLLSFISRVLEFSWRYNYSWFLRKITPHFAYCKIVLRKKSNLIFRFLENSWSCLEKLLKKFKFNIRVCGYIFSRYLEKFHHVQINLDNNWKIPYQLTGMEFFNCCQNLVWNFSIVVILWYGIFQLSKSGMEFFNCQNLSQLLTALESCRYMLTFGKYPFL